MVGFINGPEETNLFASLYWDKGIKLKFEEDNEVISVTFSKGDGISLSKLECRWMGCRLGLF
jgi:hypothetical protein